jgi:hypothetical protein
MSLFTTQSLIIASISGGIACGCALLRFDRYSRSIEAQKNLSESRCSTPRKVAAMASVLFSTALGAGLGTITSVVVNTSRHFLQPGSANCSEVTRDALISGLWGAVGAGALLSVYGTRGWNWIGTHLLDNDSKNTKSTMGKPITI